MAPERLQFSLVGLALFPLTLTAQPQAVDITPTQAVAFQFTALLLSKFWYSSWSTITAQWVARSCT